MWQDDFKNWQAFALMISDRQKALVAQIDKRFVAAMRQIDPSLPNTNEAFHLAHNWHKCRNMSGDDSRKIAWLLDSHYRAYSRAIKLCEDLKTNSFRRLINKYREA